MFNNAVGAFFGALLIIASLDDGLAYSKYGRSCRDIGCPSDEVCVMQEDPCTTYSGDKCGRYPTCKKVKEQGCSSIVCRENEFCKTINGVPKCVDRETGNEYESSGVSYVNGQRVSSGGTHVNSHPSSNNNANPYANANAPSLPFEPSHNAGGNGGSFQRTNTGTNLGYPASNQGDRPAYPPNPAYPPMPGYPSNPVYPAQPGYPQQPGYPSQQYPNVGQRYPVGQYPGYQNYPQQNQRGFGYNTHSVHYGPPNNAVVLSFSPTTLYLTTIILILRNLLEMC